MELFSRADHSDDAVLLAGLALGDDAAATAFVRRFQVRGYGLSVAITRDPGTAQDVSQEVFVRAWRSAGTYDPRHRQDQDPFRAAAAPDRPRREFPRAGGGGVPCLTSPTPPRTSWSRSPSMTWPPAAPRS